MSNFESIQLHMRKALNVFIGSFLQFTIHISTMVRHKNKISAPQMQKRRPFFTANISQIWLIGFGTNLMDISHMDKKNTALEEKANKGTFFKAHIPTSIINCVQLSIIPNSILSAIFEFEFCVHILEYFIYLNVFVFLIFFASLKLTQYCQQGVDTDIFVFSFLCV